MVPMQIEPKKQFVATSNKDKFSSLDLHGFNKTFNEKVELHYCQDKVTKTIIQLEIVKNRRVYEIQENSGIQKEIELLFIPSKTAMGSNEV